MKLTEPDEWKTRKKVSTEASVRAMVELILENYTFEEVLEMNDMTPEEALLLLYMEGMIKEPEAYFP